jgi:hypothetical protein
LPAWSQAHYGVDEDEEWWPGRVLGVHSQGAHAGLFDVLYDDGEFELFKPSRRVRLPRPKLGAQAAGQAMGRAMGRAMPAPAGRGTLADDDDDDGVEVETIDGIDEEEEGVSGGGGASGEEAAPAHKKRKVTSSGFPPRAPPSARP